MPILAFTFLIIISLGGVLIGLLLFLNPALSITIQKRFYERINWKIEPISMPKEIRNTKIMGGLLIIVALMTMAYIIIKLIR